MAVFQRNPTFVVDNTEQRKLLSMFQRREQNLQEEYRRNKPLCFNGRGFQKSHPAKTLQGRTDADATLVSPMLLGVADGVSQIEDFGIDPSELPHELLKACGELALEQLFPAVAPGNFQAKDPYVGPIPLMRRAFEATESLGSTTVLLSILDNSSRIHGKLHPMIAVIAIGDCEVLILRRCGGRGSALEAVFHTEMQRIDGNAQAPLQVARVDDRVDVNFDEAITIDVIERGSAVHCMSAYEGDIVLQGSDGVFDNLYLDEIVDICNEYLAAPQPGAKFTPVQPSVLEEIARRVVSECHKKTDRDANGGLYDSPIGRGGKVDDVCCVVGEVIEWTDQHTEVWGRVQKRQVAKYTQSSSIFCSIQNGLEFLRCGQDSDSDEASEYGTEASNYNDHAGSEYGNDENDPANFFGCKPKPTGSRSPSRSAAGSRPLSSNRPRWA